MDATDMRYLELLSRLFPSADKASAEIINLSAILNLPKGTEFFASDIHGEYEAFSHTLRNGSGSIRLKIDDVFGDSLSENEKRSLATLIYYCLLYTSRRHRGHPDGRVTHHRPKNTLEGRFACFSGDDARAMVHQRYLPVTLSGLSATCSGVPTATMRPPEAPPPGPRSTT